MKKNIITAAFTAASALLLVSSCAKEQVNENINTGDGKTFTASIEEGLKTTITGEYKVNWDQGDQINIDGAIYSATPDASDATKATFTKVSGSDPDGTFGYTAVYPASIMVGTQATLPATQTYAAGKFNAPMCAMSETESLEFKNLCGVLCLSLKGTDKVKSIAVTANEQLCGTIELFDATSFGFDGTIEGYTVTLDCGEGVQLDASTATNFYISLPPATYTAGMKIVITNTEGKTIEKTTTKSAAIARNKIYTFNWTASFSPAEPEYVEIGGVKWATKNLGATTVAGSASTCYGDYFAWGATELAYSSLSSDTFTFVASRPASYGGSGWDQSKGFAYVNTPYWNGSAYTKYTEKGSYPVLESGDDAATALLGSGWRMPTSQEFQDLYDACGGSCDEITNPSGASASVVKGVYWCTSYDGVAGCLFCDGTNKLFFPAAGIGSDTSLSKAGSKGIYLSSTAAYNPVQLLCLDFGSGNVNARSAYIRTNGFSVRPVKDAAPAPTPTTTGTAKRTGDIDVNWVQLWENGPKFAEYNVGAEYNKPEDYGCLLGWGGTQDKNQNDYNKGSVPLTGDYDTATNLWGSNWRMPTREEFHALLENVNCTWTENYNGSDVNGWLCTGKGAYSSNSIFLPAAGYSTVIPLKQNVCGRYWSSTPDDDNYSVFFTFDSDDNSIEVTYRKYGLSVRAVLTK